MRSWHLKGTKVSCFLSPGKHAFFACLVLAPISAAATPCTALSDSKQELSRALGNKGRPGDPVVFSITAQDVAENALEAGVRTPEVCSVKLVASSDGDPRLSQIAIAVMLPEIATGTASIAAWNGRFLGTGNGGFGGGIATGNMFAALSPPYVATGQTYVVANTDLGTGILFGCTAQFCGSAQGVALYPHQKPGGLHGDAAAIQDFGSAATHLMTLAGRALTGAFYGQAPRASYFHGCSTGGRQALMEAQRFPADYDGILAGSPAYDLTRLHGSAADLFEANHFGPVDAQGLPDSFLTSSALALGHSAMLAQCVGKDGGLPGDDFLMRPSLCRFDAATLQCNGGIGDVPCTDRTGAPCTCLTHNQSVVLNRVWDGQTDSGGRILFPGYERGAEEDLGSLTLPGGLALTEPLYDSTDDWVFGSRFDWTSLFATTHAPQGALAGEIDAIDRAPVAHGSLAETLNANTADLRAFRARGGKLIVYAGYADPRITAASAIDYYNQALRDNPSIHDFAMLYLAPGMWHCNGGPGANVFGNVSPNASPAPASSADDVLAALLLWREAGLRPGRIIATKYRDDAPSQGIAFQRPLCPYPENARYAAATNGDPNLAASFVCQHDSLVINQPFAPIYGPR